MPEVSPNRSRSFGTFRVMPICQRPGCSRDQTGTMLLHRKDQRVEIVALGDSVGDRYGIALCAVHLERMKPPSGWTLLDRRAPPAADPALTDPAARPRVHGAPGSSTNPGAPVWAPRRGREVPDEISTPSSPLLRRAFLGAAESLSGLERMKDQVQRDPEGLGGGVDEGRHQDGHREGGREHRHGADIGPAERDTAEQGDQDQEHGHNRVHTDGTDEMAGLTLEGETAPGAFGREAEPSGRETAASAHCATAGGATPEEAALAGGGSHIHDEQPKPRQLRLMV